ncbi:MAG TPA: T9SS type A sorting domain-containing protein [Puia sp.]|nr:T9SS type A sorting domain-containing protein [Puia sp.]
MTKINLFLLTVLCLALTMPGLSQSMSNTDNVITLNNTCLNAGVSNGTYNLELNYYDTDIFASQTVTINGVSVAVSGGVMTITAPGGSFPSTNIKGWSLPDAWPGHIKLTSGSFIGYMDFFGLPDGTVGFNCIALPVYFNSFTGSLSGSSVALNWQTGLESNSTAFEIYRSSTGGDYYKIGQVAATGISNSSYGFTDANPDAINYYYLKELRSGGLPALFTTIVVVHCSSCHYTPPTQVNCNISINGPDHICNLETPTVYTLSSPVPNYSTITWSIDQPSAAVLRTYPAFDRGQVTLLKKNGQAGVTLYATLSGCWNTISKVIALGTPATSISTDLRCPFVDASAGNAPGSISFAWYLYDNNTGSTSNDPDNTSLYTGFLGSGDSYNVGVSYTNGCGTSNIAWAYGLQCDGGGPIGGGGIDNGFVVSPNPSSGAVTIDLSSSSVKPAIDAKGRTKTPAGLAGVYRVRVVDALGVVRRLISYHGETKVTLDLSGLAKGVYTVQVFDNKTWHSSKVILVK